MAWPCRPGSPAGARSLKARTAGEASADEAPAIRHRRRWWVPWSVARGDGLRVPESFPCRHHGTQGACASQVLNPPSDYPKPLWRISSYSLSVIMANLPLHNHAQAFRSMSNSRLQHRTRGWQPQAGALSCISQWRLRRCICSKKFILNVSQWNNKSLSSVTRARVFSAFCYYSIIYYTYKHTCLLLKNHIVQFTQTHKMVHPNKTWLQDCCGLHGFSVPNGTSW